MALIYGEQRAVNELRSILKSQWKNGMLPHIRFVPGQEYYSPGPEEWGVTKEISGSEMDTSGITQPPNPGIALWNLYYHSKNKDMLIPFVEEAYEKIKKYHEFLFSDRDPKGEALPVIFHPWSSGTDNSPCYDAINEKTLKQLQSGGFKQRVIRYENLIQKRQDIDAGKALSKHRPKEKDYELYGRLLGFFAAHKYNQKEIYEKCPFVVQDVMFNSILAEAISCMTRISNDLATHYEASNEKSEYYANEVQINSQLESRLKNAIREKLYDSETGLFYNFDVRNNELIKIPTIHSLTPLFGKVADEEQAKRLIEHIKNPESFWPKHGFAIPSTAINCDKFENARYWRGPVWPVTNWLIIRGLENYDIDLANKLKTQTINMIAEGYDIQEAKKLAASLMEYTSYGEELTTPSKRQYCHGWLWDSGFAAVGWPNVLEKKSPEIWEKLNQRKDQLIESKVDPKNLRMMLGNEFKIPMFDEYYAAISDEDYKAGAPLGAEMMTWTAALFLDLMRN